MHIKFILGVLLLLTSTIVISQTLEEEQVYVNGNCGICKNAIELAAMESPGVRFAAWDKESKVLNLVYDSNQFDKDNTLIHIGNMGYDNEDYVANDDIYEDLNDNCHYRSSSKVGYDEFHDKQAEQDNLDVADHKQTEFRGVVYNKDQGEKETLPGVHVYYLGTETGVITDQNGCFSLPYRDNTKEFLVLTYLGYQNDTISVEGNVWITATLNEGVIMETVEIHHRKKTTEFSFINPLKVESISKGELEKAACCNLSESFETNASVDASITDAVTGTRQIQMLGLASPYVQITLEGVPYIRGLSAVSGFKLVPGPWIQSMQLNTGAGSVTDGFEAMTGQINVQYKDPTSDEKLFVNLYANKSGAMETNLIVRPLKTEKAKASLLLHTKYRGLENDHNSDGFLDAPLSKQVFLSNKWKFKLSDTWNSRLLFNASISDESGGQYKESIVNPWKMLVDEKKLDGYIKSGKRFEHKEQTSLGFIGSASYHEESTQYGSKTYDATHKNLYSNLIFESIIGSINHKYRVGLSFQSDDMVETLNGREFVRDEKIIGTHAEYTYKYETKFTAVLGLRADMHNKYGLFFTPRLHLRYMPVESLVFRASMGKGRRTASIFSENPGILVSSREIIVEGQDVSDDPYGLGREESWTIGGNVSYNWTVFGKETIWSTDYYYTSFDEKVVIDWDNPSVVSFYMLDGTSYSKSFKTQLDIELLTSLNLRLAYRYNDVMTDYKSGFREKPLNANHRFFANFAYESSKLWKIDLTINRQGSKRLPITISNPEAYQLEERSPAYYSINSQISKTIGSWEIYIGGENIGNYKQSNPILSADDPWSPYFDASMIWGPVFGSNFYIGMRYSLKD